MKNYDITVNCPENKQGVEVRFNFDLEKVTWTYKDDTGEEKTVTLKDIVHKAFWNEETHRPNWFNSRQYYYTRRDTEMFEKVVWLLRVLKNNNYTFEMKELSRSMTAPKTARR